MYALSQSSRHGHSHPWALSSAQLVPKPAGLTGKFLIDSEILYDASCESVVLEDGRTQFYQDIKSE